MSLRTVTPPPLPGVAELFAETPRSGSAMRMRKESKNQGQSQEAVALVDRTMQPVMELMGRMREELAATKQDVVALRAALAQSQARYTTLVIATQTKHAAQMATTAAAIERLGAVTGELEALKLATAPIIEQHLAPPPPPTRQVPICRDGVFSGGFHTERLIGGEWRQV